MGMRDSYRLLLLMFFRLAEFPTVGIETQIFNFAFVSFDWDIFIQAG